MTQDDDQTTLRACAFCGDHAPPDQPFGTATAYIRFPDADGGIASGSSGATGKSGTRAVGICLGCALARTPPVDEPIEAARGVIDAADLGRCDLCGHVGPTIGGCCGTDPRRYRLQDLMVWRVSIRGLDGCLTVCRDCTPITDWDLYRRDGATYLRDVADVPTRAAAGAGTAPIEARGDAPDPEPVDLGRWSG